jgi:hypothetical protein
MPIPLSGYLICFSHSCISIDIESLRVSPEIGFVAGHMEAATFKVSIVNVTTGMRLDKKRYFHAICRSNVYTTYLAFCYSLSWCLLLASEDGSTSVDWNAGLLTQ